jgi:hypothetical protein
MVWKIRGQSEPTADRVTTTMPGCRELVREEHEAQRSEVVSESTDVRTRSKEVIDSPRRADNGGVSHPKRSFE